MLQKLNIIIMLLSSAQKSPIMLLRIAHYSQNYSTIIGNASIRPFSLMFKLQIDLNTLAGCCIRVFNFNVTALLE